MRPLLILLTILLIGGCSEKETSNPQRPLTELTIGSGKKARRFDVETSITENEMRLGLMYRQELPDNQGMIFIFPPRSISMWMKNTYIPLDMIFVDTDNKINGIVENTVPFSETFIQSPKGTKAVIELKAGTVKKHKIHKGERAKHKLLGNL